MQDKTVPVKIKGKIRWGILRWSKKNKYGYIVYDLFRTNYVLIRGAVKKIEQINRNYMINHKNYRKIRGSLYSSGRTSGRTLVLKEDIPVILNKIKAIIEDNDYLILYVEAMKQQYNE